MKRDSAVCAKPPLRICETRYNGGSKQPVCKDTTLSRVLPKEKSRRNWLTKSGSSWPSNCCKAVFKRWLPPTSTPNTITITLCGVRWLWIMAGNTTAMPSPTILKCGHVLMRYAENMDFPSLRPKKANSPPCRTTFGWTNSSGTEQLGHFSTWPQVPHMPTVW